MGKASAGHRPGGQHSPHPLLASSPDLRSTPCSLQGEAGQRPSASPERHGRSSSPRQRALPPAVRDTHTWAAVGRTEQLLTPGTSREPWVSQRWHAVTLCRRGGHQVAVMSATATREHVPAPWHPHLLTDQRPSGVMVKPAAGELVLGGPPGGLASLVAGIQAGGAQGSSQDVHLRCGPKDRL